MPSFIKGLVPAPRTGKAASVASIPQLALLLSFPHQSSANQLTRDESTLFSFAGGLGEEVSNENATSTNHSDKAVKKGNVVPHPDLWVSFIYFFIPCKSIFLYCFVHVSASVPGRSALPRHFLLWVNSLKGWVCLV